MFYILVVRRCNFVEFEGEISISGAFAVSFRKDTGFKSASAAQRHAAREVGGREASGWRPDGAGPVAGTCLSSRGSRGRRVYVLAHSMCRRRAAVPGVEYAPHGRAHKESTIY